MLGGSEVIAAEMKQVIDLVVRRKAGALAASSFAADIDSLLEGTRFELVVPFEPKRSAPGWRALISGGG